ncbi:MAG: AMP phosphorylase [Candidatus Undinarchaeales archaeon]|jgi:AMP phosphorylase|nr:AMP phosphorylase [Candidatus Undinarchaeales archaeon]
MDIHETVLKARPVDLDLGPNSVLLNAKDAKAMGIRARGRVRISGGGTITTATAFITGTLVRSGEVGILPDIGRMLNVKGRTELALEPVGLPESTLLIRRKVLGEKLDKSEIASIVNDVVERKLTDIELSAFVSGLSSHGMDMEEVANLTMSMVNTGKRIELNIGRVFDKHSIGGVPGDKTTLLVVPIVAAANLVIPKTSSRAITSAAGTADVMEVLAPIEFGADQIEEIIKKAGGCLVWGGTMDLLPADSMLIEIERPLSLDPECLVLASVLGKKKAAGSNYVVIDIPVGNGCKVTNDDDARNLGIKFIELGQRLGMQVECAITFGGQPVGRAVGPALEAREALEALNGKYRGSFTEKATSLAGILLELGGAAAHGKGKARAEELLESGQALKKFKQIIKLQGGNPDIKPEDIELGKFKQTVNASHEGYVTSLNNAVINRTTRLAGAPRDKKAGMYLHAKKGHRVEMGAPLFTIYSSSESNLDRAVKYSTGAHPLRVEGMVLQRVNTG